MPQTSANFDHYLNLIPDHRADAIELIEMLKNGQTLEEIAESICETLWTDHGYELNTDQTVADLATHIGNHIVQIVARSENLEDLCKVLNQAQIFAAAAAIDLESLIDITELPWFGPEPTDTLEVFSWDETRILIYGSAWTIQDREPELVEHDDGRAKLAGWLGGASWGWSGDDESEFKAAIWEEMEAQGVRAAPWFESKWATLDAIDISLLG